MAAFTKLQAAVVAAVAGFTFLPALAAAKLRHCDVRVAGFQAFHGTCDFRAEQGGSFHLSRARADMLVPTPAASYDEQDSVYVKVIAPGTALLFGIGGAHQTGTYLATLYQQGACWVSRPPADTFNGDARVCTE